ncbi:hypothetical protein IEQ34_010245 [Dendrobium chrysotoxum]|uniref:Uncharacterized protein n=1 Tax=Dendrobium chrysotoxum TaxID=161865 RepID=A0AAV7H378_DENCH|nr:hypothetical protein IEQ34_010245 [Dendrobium chrysotoxum]
MNVLSAEHEPSLMKMLEEFYVDENNDDGYNNVQFSLFISFIKFENNMIILPEEIETKIIFYYRSENINRFYFIFMIKYIIKNII